jgi:hypothetical protein
MIQRIGWYTYSNLRDLKFHLFQQAYGIRLHHQICNHYQKTVTNRLEVDIFILHISGLHIMTNLWRMEDFELLSQSNWTLLKSISIFHRKVWHTFKFLQIIFMFYQFNHFHGNMWLKIEVVNFPLNSTSLGVHFYTIILLKFHLEVILLF